MKQFKDLEFDIHPAVSGGLMARMKFDNGFGVSVVGGGYGLYGDGVRTWEVAITKDGELTYDTHITNDVIGYQLEEEVTSIMESVQKLCR